MNVTVAVSSKVLTGITLAYLYIPILLFLFGWTNMPTAVVSSLAIAVCAIRLFRNISHNSTGTCVVRLDFAALLFAIILFCVIGYYAGWGRWVPQPKDWKKHNAILNDLVNLRWPILYRNGNEHSMLSYYIAFYLVPAFAGKLAHSFRVAEKVLYAWGVVGLVLTYVNLVSHVNAQRRTMQVLCAMMIVFFGIPLWLSQFVLKSVSEFNTLGHPQWFYMGEAIKLQYSDNFTLLNWVVPQVIACWLIVLLFFKYRDNMESYLFLMLPGLLFGTFSFLGIVPIALAQAFGWWVRKKDTRAFLRKVLSTDNLLVLFTLGAVFLLYLYGNVFSDKPEDVGFRMMRYGPDYRVLYIVFVSINVLPYAAVFWRDHKTDMVYYAAFATLLLLPAFSMGYFNDLMMRTSIPALFILMVYAIEFWGTHVFRDSGQSRRTSMADRVVWGACSLLVTSLVLIGAHYPIEELFNAIKGIYPDNMENKVYWRTMSTLANRERKESNDAKYNYFAYDIDNNLFFKYLADRPKDNSPADAAIP